MRASAALSLLLALGVFGAAGACKPPPPPPAKSRPEAPPAAEALKAGKAETLRGLKNAHSFSALEEDEERGLALFTEAGKVLRHARCVNCHPSGERPMQQDQSRPHEPPVVRGEDGHGAPGLRCSTCHASENVEIVGASIPGHHDWHLAPASMAWAGVSLPAICEQIKDPERNGDKTLEEIVHHFAEDSLVGWGWRPGRGREPPPGSQEVLAGLIRAWVDAGAPCPKAAATQAALDR